MPWCRRLRLHLRRTIPGTPLTRTSPPAAIPPAKPPGLIIEHHQQGTLVHGTQKNDHQLRRLLPNHGFRWSGNLNAWYLPRPWTFSTRRRRVSSLTADLRQAHRSFTLRTQPSAPSGADDSPPSRCPPQIPTPTYARHEEPIPGHQ